MGIGSFHVGGRRISRLLATLALALLLSAGALPVLADSSSSPSGITPTHLTIPSIGVDAPIDQVGLTDAGALDVPPGWWDTGWFNLGYQPGTAGNAVIDGHLDSDTGTAVFWYLRSVQLGDAVYVDDGTTTLTFIVQDVETYPADNSPMQQVYGPSSVPRLNLVTCGGTWNFNTHSYSNRTVVYTVLQGYTGGQ